MVHFPSAGRFGPDQLRHDGQLGEETRLQQSRAALLLPGVLGGGPTLLALVNREEWNELPKSYQAALIAACGEANA